MIHENASDLWPQLVLRAGLDIPAKGWVQRLLGKKAEKRTTWYDEDLVSDLRARIFPNATGAFEDLLARSTPPVSADTLLRNFLQVLQPFSMMKQGILEMLSAAGAKKGDDNLRIRFHFNESDDPLELLLSDFREQMEVVERRTRTVSVALWNIEKLWSLLGIPRDHPDWPEGRSPKQPLDPVGQAIVDWVEEVRSTHRFPAFPTGLETGRKELDRPLRLVADILQQVLSVYRRYGSDYAVLRAASDAARETVDPIGVRLQDLAQMESDYWSASAGEWLAKVRQVAASAGPGSSLLTTIISEIDQLFPAAGQAEVTELFRTLDELLNLPVWKKREQVYSVWIGTQIWRALKGQWRFRFHVQDGTLSFAFSGVHLATLFRQEEVLDWWTELATPAKNLPSGHRSRAIKPDYRIRRPPFSGPGTDVLVVEVKQYMRGGTANFSAALLDYAHACPRAGVLLANYGPVHDNALAPIPSSAKDRVQAFGQIRPDHESNCQDFQNEIIRAVRTGGPNSSPSSPPRRIELAWGAEPRDLDLHLFLLSPTENRVHVFYQQPAHGEAIRLQGDVTTGFGPEVLSLAAATGKFLVCVHQFSTDGTLVNSGATVRLFADDGVDNEIVAFQCPTGSPARWWAVCEVDATTGHVREIAELTEDPNLIDLR